ncbi:MAG TPA: FAD-dependent oxidoreductase [Trebonia sp.]
MSAPSPDPAVARSLAGALPRSFWLDGPDAPEPRPALAGSVTADLAVIGGGFTGLWTALLARERYPGLDVVLLEARTVGWAASGRNGGFCSASLTHGIGNGRERFGAEMPLLERLGRQNLEEIGAAIARYGIDCDFRPTGELALATADWQLDGLDEQAVAARQFGHDVEVLDAAGARAELSSPLWHGGLKYTTGNAMLEPGRLAWGLRQACLDAGVRIYEYTPVTSLSPGPGAGAALATPYGSVRAGRVALAAGVPGGALLRRIGAYVIPVWDYVLMTEPLTPEQAGSLGWRDQRGASDLSNQFHYFRMTRDRRVLWGGYDAVYYNGGRAGEELATNPETFTRLAAHFFAAFPQLEGVSFTHAWGGVVDTCSRFCAFFGTAHSGRVAYAAGFTGLGVGASRFAAQVLLDKLHPEEDSERSRLSLVNSRPLPFPPEPLRSAVVQVTRASIARADRSEGRRDPWLRLLDRLGLGFDS